jgi:hypothetical protein
MPITQAGPAMNVPQASASAATPLFNLGLGQGGYQPQPQLPQAQNPLIDQQQQPIQRFQSGGPVQSNQQQPTNQPTNQPPGYNLGISSPDAGTGWWNPMYQANALGAAALGYSPMVINQTPGGTPDPKSGVVPGGQPTVYPAPYTGGPITLPGGQTFSAQQLQNFGPADWAELQKAGIQRPMPSSIAGGPWATQPGIFAKAPMPTLNAPSWGGSTTAPLTAAPQANAVQMPQMNIAPAGNAATATPTQLAQAHGPDTVAMRGTPGEFVLSPEATQAAGVGNLTRFNDAARSGALGMPPAAPGGAAAGAMTALSTQPTAPAPSSAFMEGFQHGFAGAPPKGPSGVMKAQTGGYVYPQDQQQPVLHFQGGGTVPAPGPPSAPTMDLHTAALANAGMAMYAHYGGDPQSASLDAIQNFHNQLLSRLGGDQTTAGGTAPIKMETGGIVPDDPYQIPRRQASETVHRPVTAGASSAPSSSTSQPQNTPDQSSSSGSSQGPAGNSYNQAIQNAIQARNAYAAADRGMSAMGTGGYSGGGGATVGDLMGGTASQAQGTQSLGQAPAPNAQALGAASAIGGLASGLASAAQAYAASIKPWQVQKSAIPDPSQLPRYAEATLSPERV